eukprot:TRINITY_DN32167_c0_g1_i1.p2 TRINITY_DN32167_c0_g1~~TRINITY_DN32167_c0_g1_i1.p2  ORF type:complete len:524 (+),score=120.18 TRINITY_DN32167_c0_g1_i1:63-1634(+)
MAARECGMFSARGLRRGRGAVALVRQQRAAAAAAGPTYRSTRGGVSGVTFEEAVCAGYAADGGLFVPEAVPAVPPEELVRWRGLSYADLAFEVISRFAGACVPADDLREVLHAAYAGFPPVCVPVRKVAGIHVAELYHGPTFCFKDLGMQVLVRLLALFSSRSGRNRTLLASTSGDTGPALVEAVGGAASPHLRCWVFYPRGQISALQRRQMTTVNSPSVRVGEFEGSGDDMDVPIKRMAADADFSRAIGLTGVNSYNLARPVSQAVHYFWTYFRATEEAGNALPPLHVVLPTGAMGNVVGGTLAKEMGLPLERLSCAVNANDITHRAISKGLFHRSEAMVKTLSDAINIQVPYNFERLLYYATGCRPERCAAWMQEMDATGRLTLPADALAAVQSRHGSCRVDDDEMLETLLWVYKEHGYLCDPHTAVGFAGVRRLGYCEAGAPRCALLATAHPCKFEESVTKAIGPGDWARYAASGDFPAAARDLMDKPEVECRRFKAEGGLPETQRAWEQHVREECLAWA